MKRKTPVRKLLVFSAIASLLILALLEITLRIAGYSPPEKPKGMLPKSIIFDKELGWRLVPGCWAAHEGGTELSINSLGMRGDEPDPRVPDTTRIICLGDSVTFGYELPESATYPVILESLLSRHGKKVETLNASVLGYSTFQQTEWLKLDLLKLKPDIVILGFVLNDIFERYTEDARFGGKDVFLGVDLTKGLPLWKRLLRKLAMRRFILVTAQSTAKKREIYSIKGLIRENPPEEAMEAIKVSLEEVKELRKVVENGGARFLLVIFPYNIQLAAQSGYDRPQRMLMELASKEGFDAIDLLPAFRAQRNNLLFLDYNHMNPQGSAITAREIALWLRRPEGDL